MKPHILISGGTGLVGSHLAQMLIHHGYQISFLSRQYRSLTGIETIRWNPEEQWIAEFDMKDPLVIINLAGENLSAGAWTPEQKKKILNSRVDSVNLIKKLVEQKKDQITRVISTSAIGYYGTYTSNEVFEEENPSGSDFLADTCMKWEKAIQTIADTGVSTACIRTGVVLSNMGGALKAMQESMRLGLALPLGSGAQWVPWIHVRDLIRIFEFLIDKPQIQGVYNAVSPAEDTNRSLTKAIAKVRKKVFVPIGVPAFILKMILGEMAVISLHGSRVSSEKIQKTGFRFQHTEIESALRSFQQPRPGATLSGFSADS